MKKKKFLKEFSGAAVDDVELAEAASEVTDDDELKTAAEVFLDAKSSFDAELESLGLVRG